MSTETAPSKKGSDGWVRTFIGTFAAEYFGTYLLLLAPLIVATGSSLFHDADPIGTMFAVALTFGLTLFGLVVLFAERSGANFNPAITVGLWLNKQMHGIVALVYIVAQFAGAITAAATIRLLFAGQSASGFGATTPAHGASIIAVVAVEFGGTTWLTHTVATVAIGKKSELASALTIGAVLAVIVMAGEFFTGGAYNPARAIGPMLLTGQMQYAWYVVPEFVGGWLGIAVFVRGLRKVEQPAPPA